MHVVYALEPLPDPVRASLFLAGPTPRDAEVASWRPEALSILAELGFVGAVIVPEPRSGEWRHSYVDQTGWEAEMRARADLIAFWVPRELTQMPAFTTNVEFGEDYDSCRCLYGRPGGAPKTRYLDVRWEEISGHRPHDTLADLLAECVGLLGDGAMRGLHERDVPLCIWRSAAFARWYESVRGADETLAGFRLLYTVPEGKRHPASPVKGFLAEATLETAEERVGELVFLAQRDEVTVISGGPAQ